MITALCTNFQVSWKSNLVCRGGGAVDLQEDLNLIFLDVVTYVSKLGIGDAWIGTDVGTSATFSLELMIWRKWLCSEHLKTRNKARKESAVALTSSWLVAQGNLVAMKNLDSLIMSQRMVKRSLAKWKTAGKAAEPLGEIQKCFSLVKTGFVPY